ncbi:MAG: efflux RND transporter periplasmic adaptor subunit [Proteocatella sp.]
MKMNCRKSVLALTLLLTTSMLLSGCGKEVVEEEIIKSVEVKQIYGDTYQNKLSLSGNILPSQVVKVAFKVPGVVTQANFEEGTFVKKGQLIAAVEQDEYNLQVQASSSDYESAKLQIESEIPARINQAKAQYELSKATYDRVKALYEAGGATKSQLDEITAKKTADENTYKIALEAESIARTKLEKAEAGLELSNTKLSDTSINSPIEGIVMKKLVEEGEIIAQGYPVAAIGQVDVVDVEIGVSDQDIKHIEFGQKVKVYLYGLDKSFDGVVGEISPSADPTTRTFAVKVKVKNPNFEIKPGMVAKVDIPVSSVEGILIPVSSVLSRPEGEVVYIYNEETKTVRKQLVETGDIVKDKITIVSGIKNGEKLVVDGQFKLNDNDKVSVEEK